MAGQKVLQKALDTAAVRRAYQRWAPFYDYSFGVVSSVGRKAAVRHINTRQGTVLEVGVGTGLSLPHYAPHLKITGIDLSADMLEKARMRATKLGLKTVSGLYEMDASAMTFPDASFDTVVAMYVMTVVPDSTKVMRELSRVCSVGGEVLLVNHFSVEHGLRGWTERKMAPYAETLGWHPVFPPAKVMVCNDLKLIEQRPLFPAGLFSMLRFQKL